MTRSTTIFKDVQDWKFVYETFYNDIYLGYTEQCHGNLSKRMPDLLGCHINL